MAQASALFLLLSFAVAFAAAAELHADRTAALERHMLHQRELIRTDAGMQVALVFRAIYRYQTELQHRKPTTKFEAAWPRA